ncbi:MAG: hypothetical protein EOO38_02815 [Cytophagaceae bacterium]|nr:MAG: hypothetical protein EOO38_02815 [Cytophagaceae bacterium]
MAIATDAAGYLPAQPVFRVTAWAIAWAPTARDAPAAEVFACPSPHGDTSIATAELLAAVIAAISLASPLLRPFPTSLIPDRKLHDLQAHTVHKSFDRNLLMSKRSTMEVSTVLLLRPRWIYIPISIS